MARPPPRRIRPAPAARRRRQVRLLRRLPADPARPRGRAARDRRAVRHRRVRRRRPRAARPARSTSSSSRARSARREQAEEIAPPAARDAAAGHDRRLRDRRRHPGAPQLVRRTTRPGRGLPAARVRRRRSRSRRRSPTTSPSTPSCAAARSTRASSLELLTALLVGRRPQLPDESVCLECKRRGAVCVLVAGGSPASGRSPRPAAAPSARPSDAAATAASGRASGANVASLAGTLRVVDGRAPRRSAACSPASPPGPEPFRSMIDQPAGRPAPAPAAVPGERDRTREATMHGTPDARRGRDASAFEVDGLTRVEGEGSLRLRRPRRRSSRRPPGDLRGAALLRAARRRPDARRGPRHRRAHLRHLPRRLPDERRARVRGPRSGSTIDPAVRALRRLLYCGEWIESHALHVYLLHAPDFLGYASAVELARDHRAARRARPRAQAGRQPDRRAPRRPADPSGQRAGRRLLAASPTLAS